MYTYSPLYKVYRSKKYRKRELPNDLYNFLLEKRRRGRTLAFMIRSIRNAALQNYYETGTLPVEGTVTLTRLSRILLVLDAASKPKDLDLPGFGLCKLEGSARWGMQVTDNWRISFTWHKADAINVDLENHG